MIALDTTNALLDRYPYRLLHLTLKNPEDELPESIKEKVDSFSGNELTLRLHRNTDPIGHILDVLHSENIAFSDLRTDEPRLEDALLP